MAPKAPTRNFVLQLVLVLHASMDCLVKVAGSNVTAVECVGGFQNLAFDLKDFERYPDFFREESTINLAQTGTYKGPNEMEEYVRFVFPSSPYLAGVADVGSPIGEVKAIEGDICVFSAVFVQRYIGDEMTALKGPPFDVPAMNHIYYNPSENYIEKIIVYYEIGFLDFYFDKFLNTPQTRDFICGIMSNVCGFDIDAAFGDCQETLETLPTVTNSSYLDGNSQGCRALHTVFAETNPTNHCPHLAFDPTPDPKGNVKCQNSKLVDPLDLFDQEDIAMFREFSMENGIDPAVGYVLVTEEEEETSSASRATSHCIMLSSVVFAAFVSAVIPSF